MKFKKIIYFILILLFINTTSFAIRNNESEIYISSINTNSVSVSIDEPEIYATSAILIDSSSRQSFIF